MIFRSFDVICELAAIELVMTEWLEVNGAGLKPISSTWLAMSVVSSLSCTIWVQLSLNRLQKLPLQGFVSISRIPSRIFLHLVLLSSCASSFCFCSSPTRVRSTSLRQDERVCEMRRRVFQNLQPTISLSGRKFYRSPGSLENEAVLLIFLQFLFYLCENYDKDSSFPPNFLSS